VLSRWICRIWWRTTNIRIRWQEGRSSKVKGQI